MGPRAEDRWKQHIRAAVKGSRLYFSNAIRKYGSDAFTVEVIYRAETSDELSKAEIALIALHQSHKPGNGYNMTPGGDGAPSGELNWMYGRPKTGSLLDGCKKGGKKSGPMNLGRTRSAETRRRLSEYKKSHLPVSACEPFQNAISALVQQGLDAPSIWRQLKHDGFQKSVQSVRRFILAVRGEPVQNYQARAWTSYLQNPQKCQNCQVDLIPKRRRDLRSFIRERKYCSRGCANTTNNQRSKAAAA